MSELNKTILQQANAAVSAGDNEGFLSFCADDIVWSTVGGETLHGKEAVRAWMAQEYVVILPRYSRTQSDAQLASVSRA